MGRRGGLLPASLTPNQTDMHASTSSTISPTATLPPDHQHLLSKLGSHQEAFDELRHQAIALDSADPLAPLRHEFHWPQYTAASGERKQFTYLVGNSLGLQPKVTAAYVQEALDSWAQLAVEGHFSGEHPYMYYHRLVAPGLAELVGASEQEVVAMNGLTTNLHLMMASFYQPKGIRRKILMEAGAFPSDQYAVETMVRFHGLDPADAIVEVTPRAGERALHMEDILAAIHQTGEELALVLFSGVQYATGQVFDMEAIVKAGHAVGAYVGLDLAHGIGNVELKLHDWNADFACWCTYKYLNSGPGGIAGVFVHERHGSRPELPRLAGWWGHHEGERFLMRKGFVPMEGAQGWQHSNGPVLLLATLRASLHMVEKAGWQRLLAKQASLRKVALACLQLPALSNVTLLTPMPGGCQYSLVVPGGKAVFTALRAAGVLGDWREPDIIRLSPTPMYNSHQDVVLAMQVLSEVLASV